MGSWKALNETAKIAKITRIAKFRKAVDDALNSIAKIANITKIPKNCKFRRRVQSWT